jgi:hypothetical protein
MNRAEERTTENVHKHYIKIVHYDRTTNFIGFWVKFLRIFRPISYLHEYLMDLEEHIETVLSLD